MNKEVSVSIKKCHCHITYMFITK